VKQLLAVIALLIPIAAHAEACPHIEYAELKDMKKDELQAKFCELKQYQASKKQDADSAARSGQIIALQLLQYSFQCESEANRVSDVMERSFSSQPSACDTKQEKHSDSAHP